MLWKGQVKPDPEPNLEPDPSLTLPLTSQVVELLSTADEMSGAREVNGAAEVGGGGTGDGGSLPEGITAEGCGAGDPWVKASTDAQVSPG